MIYCYLFEAKSIQAYLFGSGKLRDVIAASERLDRFIDSDKESLLHHVLTQAQLDSDLLDEDCPDRDDLIRFLRCKGGAFYCYAKQKDPLLKLRSLWTLSIEQMFPSLQFTDALTHGEGLKDALDTAHQQLAASRNTPTIKLPIASAPSHRTALTGNAAVPLSSLAKQGSFVKEDKLEADIDTELHRQAYQALDMRYAAALQGKFTPENGVDEFSYPIDLENDFLFGELSGEITKSQREAVKDIALIHIDGNGLGLLLMELKEALKDAAIDNYRKGFRLFSEALNKATISAAREATLFIYQQARYLNTREKGKTRMMIPLRPIVLGGDDITLLCRADLALEFSQIFCRAFKTESEKSLKPLFKNYLPKSKLKPYLTASGGILYHKAGHPFTHSHHLVEELCAHAKKLTKSPDANGQAALAFHRLSNAVYESFEQVVKRSLTLGNQKQQIQIGRAAYFVDETSSKQLPFDLNKLNNLVQFCTQKNSPVSISRWRQMATSIALGDFDEADRIYHRGRELANVDKDCQELDKLLDALTPADCKRNNWFWTETQTGQPISIINDLLVAHHFQSFANAKYDLNEKQEPSHA